MKISNNKANRQNLLIKKLMFFWLVVSIGWSIALLCRLHIHAQQRTKIIITMIIIVVILNFYNTTTVIVIRSNKDIY